MAKKNEKGLTSVERLEQALVPEGEWPYKVPENWVWVRFGSAIELISGRDVTSNLCNDIEIGIPYILGASNLEEDSFTVERWIADPVVVSIKGDILLSVKGTIGKIYLQTEPEINISRQIMAVRASSITERKFLKHFLISNVDMLKEAANGLIPGISREIILNQSFPLPPLPEQQRIVDRIESLFEKLDQAKGLIRDALDSFENRKAAILHKAFSGELTRKWREENGDVIWSNCILGDVIVEKPRNGYSPVGVAYETKYKNLTLTATTSGVFRGEFFKYVDIEIEENSYLLLKKDDILIQRANSLEYVGVCAIYDGNDNEYIYPDLMMKIRANSRVLTKYLYYALTSSSVKEYYRNNATGTAGNMPKINQTVVNNTPIILPPLQEQKEIVSILDDLFEKERNAKDLVNSIDTVDCMKKSILARAFRGELGTNDPEEESAIEMLREALIQEGAEL